MAVVLQFPETLENVPSLRKLLIIELRNYNQHDIAPEGSRYETYILNPGILRGEYLLGHNCTWIWMTV